MILQVTLDYTSINQFNDNTESISSSEIKKIQSLFQVLKSIRIHARFQLNKSLNYDYISTSKFNENKEFNSIENSDQIPTSKNSVYTEQISNIQVNDNKMYVSTNQKSNKYIIIPSTKSQTNWHKFCSLL